MDKRVKMRGVVQATPNIDHCQPVGAGGPFKVMAQTTGRTLHCNSRKYKAKNCDEQRTARQVSCGH